MAILDFTTKTETAPAARSNRMPFGQMTNPADQPAAKVWLNVGYEVETFNEEGEVVKRFITLPIGSPIDTMRTAEARGQNEDWIKQQHARNELLKALQDLAAGFEPGQEQTINLVVKLRRVKEEMDVSRTTNEYSLQAGGIQLIAAE